jgi:hypothetical protein
MLFVGTVTTEAITTEATTGTTGMNFYSVLNTQMYKKNTSCKRNILYAMCIVRLTSINFQKKILKNPVFKSTFIVLDGCISRD